MMKRLIRFGAACASVIAILGAATPASAYIGPGLGLGVIASIFGAIAAFVMMLAGLIWYPVKVMLRKRREKKASAGTVSGNAADMSASSDAPGSPQD